jgi:hypothetical protein
MGIFNWALEQDDVRPLAIIITANPNYILKPKLKVWSDALYADVKARLEARGYRVDFNTGYQYNLPDPNAAVWVGHSGGINRLQYAPEHVKTLALQTQDRSKTLWSPELHIDDISHYLLSEQDMKALSAL